MRTITRRSFIQCSGGLLAFTAVDKSYFFRTKDPLMSFSTLGCPDWTLDQILEFASSHQFRGVEIRGIQRELDLSKSQHFSSDENIRATIRKFSDKGLKIINLGATSAMHHPKGEDRDKALDEARRFISIAEKCKCPYIRVFPNNFPPGQEKEATVHYMAENLSELGNFAKGSGVKVLMETHGDLVKSNEIAKVMNMTDNKNVGLVWDISNMWTVTREPVADVYRNIHKWICHTHIKDMDEVNGKEHYALMGQGKVPIFEAIDILAKDGFKGYYSFEWEKLWHPEIAEPEVAIAQYAEVMKEHFKKK